MKKLLVVAVAVLVSASAFAQKSLVRLDGCSAGRCDNLDFFNESDDADKKLSTQTIALNYAYLFTDNIGAGLTFNKSKTTKDGDVAVGGDSQGFTISGYYNFNGGWADTCYLALHLGSTTVNDADVGGADGKGEDTGWGLSTTTIEYGHRFSLGKLAGLNFNWAPSASYSMSKNSPKADGADDVTTNTLSLSVANFAVVF